MMKGLEYYDERPDGYIYVLDTETTGLYGAPQDVVVDIGVCKVDLRKCTVMDTYSSVVGHDVDEWDEYRQNAWIFQNTDMTLDMVKKGKPFPIVRKEIVELLDKQYTTSYNVAYDMKKFLYKEPWDLKGKIIERADIMLAARDVCKIPGFYDSWKYPKLEEAYRTILNGEDPAEIHGKQDHRALSDARMASYLMIEMFNNGDYGPDRYYHS